MAKSTLLIGIALFGAMLLPVPSARAQSGSDKSGESSSVHGNSAALQDQDIDLFRKDIRSKKRQLITESLKLTDADAARFWPIYDQYTADLSRINDEKYAVLQEYRNSFGSITDQQAVDLTKRALQTDERVAALRSRYLPRFLEVLPGRKLATYFQIERRLQEMINLQLMSDVPLVQDQK